MSVTTGSISVPGQIRSQSQSGRIIKQSIYEISSTQLAPLGTRLELGDRVFHYARAGSAALTDGLVVQGAVPVPAHLNCTVAATAAIGATRVSVTLGATAAAANLYAEGYMHCNDEAPEGSLYKISGHLYNAGSSAMWVNLYDPLVKALTISLSQVTLTKNKYDGLVVMPLGGLTSAPIGVPIVDVTGTYYFWAQTWGPCAVLTQGTIVIGQPVGLGGTADGAVGPLADDTTSTIGVTLRVNASTEYSLIDLRIAP